MLRDVDRQPRPLARAGMASPSSGDGIADCEPQAYLSTMPKRSGPGWYLLRVRPLPMWWAGGAVSPDRLERPVEVAAISSMLLP